MDDFDVFFAILIVTILCSVFSCIITNTRIDNVNDKVNVLEQKIAPVKSPEQLKIEDLEKQVQELSEKAKKLIDYDKASCTQ